MKVENQCVPDAESVMLGSDRATTPSIKDIHLKYPCFEGLNGHFWGGKRGQLRSRRSVAGDRGDSKLRGRKLAAEMKIEPSKLIN